MARIPVEKREGGGTPWWLWLLGLVLLVGVIWLLVEAFSGPDEAELGVTDTTMVPGTDPVPPGPGAAVGEGDASARVDSFVTFVQTEQPAEEMGLHHEYTNRGIRLLASALGAVADRVETGDVQVEARRDTLRRRAERIQRDPQSLQHANITREAFIAAADLMESLRSRQDPALDAEVQQVRQAAEAIDPQTPLLEQRERVQAFFQRAGEALQDMVGMTG